MKQYTVRTVGLLAVVALAAFCLGAAGGVRIFDDDVHILGADTKPIISFEKTGNAKIGKTLAVGGKLTVSGQDVGKSLKELDDLKAGALLVESFPVIAHASGRTARDASREAGDSPRPGVDWWVIQADGTYTHPKKFGKKVVAVWWTQIRARDRGNPEDQWSIKPYPKGERIEVKIAAAATGGHIEGMIHVLYVDGKE
jgi:hypothetical protein